MLLCCGGGCGEHWRQTSSGEWSKERGKTWGGEATSADQYIYIYIYICHSPQWGGILGGRMKSGAIADALQ